MRCVCLHLLGVIGTAVLLLLVPPVHPYNVNDSISLLEQAQVGAYKTKWHHIGKGNNPRFKVDSVATIVPPYSRQDYQTTKVFKAMFAFSNHKFLVPWILLADGSGLYLKKITFFLQHDDEKILSVNARQSYFEFDDINSHSKPKDIRLEYFWENGNDIVSPSAGSWCRLSVYFALVMIPFCWYFCGAKGLSK